MAKKKSTQVIEKPKRVYGKPFSSTRQPATPSRRRAELTPERKAFLLSTRAEFRAVLSQYMTWSKDELKKALKNEISSLPVLDIAVMKVLVESMIAGDLAAIDWALDHAFGKQEQKQALTITHPNSSGIDLDSLSDAELADLKKFMKKQEKKQINSAQVLENTKDAR